MNCYKILFFELKESKKNWLVNKDNLKLEKKRKRVIKIKLI